jgi:hypothetical protein
MAEEDRYDRILGSGLSTSASGDGANGRHEADPLDD